MPGPRRDGLEIQLFRAVLVLPPSRESLGAELPYREGPRSRG